MLTALWRRVLPARRLEREPEYRREVSGRISAAVGCLFERPDAGYALAQALSRFAA